MIKPTDLSKSGAFKGYRKARSMTGSTLGDGGDLVVINDLMKVQTALSKIQREAISGLIIKRE